MNKLLLLAIVAAVAGCSKSPTQAAAPVASTSVSEAKLTGGELCRRDLKIFVRFNDPNSVRIHSVEANAQRPGRYMMSVSAKNAMGGYGEPTTCTCGTDAAKGVVTDLHCDTAGG